MARQQNLIGMASNLRAMASNLIAMAMASNLLGMASNLVGGQVLDSWQHLRLPPALPAGVSSDATKRRRSSTRTTSAVA